MTCDHQIDMIALTTDPDANTTLPGRALLRLLTRAFILGCRNLTVNGPAGAYRYTAPGGDVVVDGKLRVLLTQFDGPGDTSEAFVVLKDDGRMVVELPDGFKPVDPHLFPPGIGASYKI